MPSARGRGSSSAGEAQPQSSEGQLELGAQQLEHPPRALLAADREAPEGRAADQDRVGAEGEGDRDVDAAPDAAVDEHRAAAGDGLDRLLEDVGGGGDAVELAPAVVGDDDAGGAVLDRQRRVLAGVDPLDQDRQPALGGERLEVGPAEAGVDQLEGLGDVTARSEPSAAATLGMPRPSGSDEAGPPVALAVAGPRGVDGDAGSPRSPRRPPASISALVTPSSLKQ